jgi:hypothetical protein
MITANGPTAFCPGGNVTLEAGNINNVSYSWKKYNNTVQGATQNIITVATSGKYRCVITDANGCSRQSDVIEVNVACRRGQQEIAGTALRAWPNPSEGSVTIDVSDFKGEITGVSIKDLKGSNVKTAMVTYNGSTVSIDGLPEGIFIATISSTQKTETIRLVRIKK